MSMFLGTEPAMSISHSKEESIVEMPIRSQESVKNRMNRLHENNYGPISTNVHFPFNFRWKTKLSISRTINK